MPGTIGRNYLMAMESHKENWNGSDQRPAVWFPAVRVGTGADVFTERLCQGLNTRNVRAEITWLPRHAEYVPWIVRVPRRPRWANIVHVNTWIHRRFVPHDVALVATAHHCVHDDALSPYKSAAQLLYHRYMVKPAEALILDRADSITAVSRYTARKIRESFGARNAQVIYNGVDRNGQAPDMMRKPHERFRLLFVGTFSRRKGADLLGPIMRKLGDEFELRFTGNPGDGHNLPRNCRSVGRPDADQLRREYLDSDALLFPTRLEGFGQVALEAMGHGLPVICTNGSALPEVVNDGVTGVLCPQNDVHAFAAAAFRLKNDVALWRSMRAAAIVHAESKSFGIDAMVNSYIRVYEAVLSTRSHGGHVNQEGGK